MNTLDAEEQALASLLHRTVGTNVHDIKQAQNELTHLEQQDRFGIILLQVLHKLSANLNPTASESAVSQAGGIFFKNYVKRKWPLYQNGVPEQQRVMIKQNLVKLLMSAPKAVQKQLCAAMELIAECDFPFEWDNLLPDMKQSLKECPTQKAVILEALEPVFRVFEEQFRTNELMRAVKYCVDNFADVHLEAFKESCANLNSVLTQQQAAAAGTAATTSSGASSLGGGSMQSGGSSASNKPPPGHQEMELRSLVASCAIFFSLNVVDLPEQYEDNMSIWYEGFFYFLKTSNFPPFLLQTDLERCNKLRAQICDNMGLYVTKYQEEVKQFVKPATAAVWQLLLELDQSDMNDNVVASGIKFLSSAAGQNWGEASPFNDLNALQQICERIVLPNIKLRQIDVELFEDSPLDFIQRDIEEADQDTRRKTAIELVKALMRFQESNVTNILMTHVRQLLNNGAQTATGSNAERCLSKESCIYVVMAMAIKGGTKQQGCTLVNAQVPFQQYFDQEVKTILQSNVDTESDFPPLRAACLKYVTQFRSLLSTESLLSVLPDIVRHVSHKSAVVHTYAAHAIEKIIMVREMGTANSNVSSGGANQTQTPQTIVGNLKFQPQQLSALLRTALEPMVNILTEKRGIEQNEYLMRCIVRIFLFLKHSAGDIAVPMLQKSTQLLEQIAANPKHPSFAHFLFEGVAVIIKVAQPTGKLDEVEGQMLKVCGFILQGEVMKDFLPYVFQVLGLLLDSTKEVKPVYSQLFQTLMHLEFWTKHPNIPALVRFLKSYLSRHEHFRALLQQNMGEILKRFEGTLNNRKTEGMAFDLLGAVFAYLPFEMYSSTVDVIFKVALTALMSRKSDVRMKKHFVLAASIFVWKRGAASLRDILERMQPGLFQQIMTNVWMAALDLMQTPPERKIAAVALTQLLFQQGVDGKVACVKLAQLLGVASLSSSSVVSAQQLLTPAVSIPGIPDISLAGGPGAAEDPTFGQTVYEGTYSKLSNADAADGGDYMIREIPDYKQHVKQQLLPHKQSLTQLAQADEKIKLLLNFLN
ncbi:unnamed protein product [Amoebophrya sp. A120]|nr:unnamed protein product [Amoebophrya sp. A120]|eukprot:GSA120T00012003001.1